MAVSQLAARLLAFDGGARSVRRIVGLVVTGDPSLTTTVRFAYQRDPA